MLYRRETRALALPWPAPKAEAESLRRAPARRRVDGVVPVGSGWTVGRVRSKARQAGKTARGGHGVDELGRLGVALDAMEAAVGRQQRDVQGDRDIELVQGDEGFAGLIEPERRGGVTGAQERPHVAERFGARHFARRIQGPMRMRVRSGKLTETPGGEGSRRILRGRSLGIFCRQRRFWSGVVGRLQLPGRSWRTQWFGLSPVARSHGLWA